MHTHIIDLKEIIQTVWIWWVLHLLQTLQTLTTQPHHSLAVCLFHSIELLWSITVITSVLSSRLSHGLKTLLIEPCSLSFKHLRSSVLMWLNKTIPELIWFARKKTRHSLAFSLFLLEFPHMGSDSYLKRENVSPIASEEQWSCLWEWWWWCAMDISYDEEEEDWRVRACSPILACRFFACLPLLSVPPTSPLCFLLNFLSIFWIVIIHGKRRLHFACLRICWKTLASEFLQFCK